METELTLGQRQALEDLDLNPDAFVNSSQAEIKDIIAAARRRAGRHHYDTTHDREREKRKQRILQLKLGAGTRVVRKISTTSKNRERKKDEVLDEVVEITPEWYVRVAHLKDPIPPSHIIKVSE